MSKLMKKKNWLGFVAALGLFALVPSVLWSQRHRVLALIKMRLSSKLGALQVLSIWLWTLTLIRINATCTAPREERKGAKYI